MTNDVRFSPRAGLALTGMCASAKSDQDRTSLWYEWKWWMIWVTSPQPTIPIHSRCITYTPLRSAIVSWKFCSRGWKRQRIYPILRPVMPGAAVSDLVALPETCYVLLKWYRDEHLTYHRTKKAKEPVNGCNSWWGKGSYSLLPWSGKW